MKLAVLIFMAGMTAGSLANAGQTVDILSLDEVAVAQMNSDGTYDVICKNGNRERVKAVDIRIGNVCPNDTSSVPTGVLSLQKREDGDFDVVCRDLSKIIATTEEILNNEVCVESEPFVVIEDGTYSAPNASDCGIKATYSGKTLTGLHATFPGTSSDMKCADNVCTGKFSGYSQIYRFEILSSTSFEYSYDNHQGVLIFKKKK